MQEYDTIIIGSGIAGMTAAIYLKRENIKVLLIEKEIPGGQLVKSPFIENYPGYVHVSGSDLALSIHEQVTSLKVESVFEEVIEIKKQKFYHEVKTNKNTYLSKTVLIATGREPRKLNIEGEDKLLGRGISYCATCDGAFYKNKDVAVVGGGSSAVTEALFLSNLCSHVYLLYRKQNLRSEDILKKRVEETKNIQVLYETEIETFEIENEKLKNLILKDKSKLRVDGLFIFIGYEPKTSFLKNTHIETKDGYIPVNEKMETKEKGIFACGDCTQKEVYQLTTAASDATIAAFEIKKYLLGDIYA